MNNFVSILLASLALSSVEAKPKYYSGGSSSTTTTYTYSTPTYTYNYNYGGNTYISVNDYGNYNYYNYYGNYYSNDRVVVHGTAGTIIAVIIFVVIIGICVAIACKCANQERGFEELEEPSLMTVTEQTTVVHHQAQPMVDPYNTTPYMQGPPPAYPPGVDPMNPGMPPAYPPQYGQMVPGNAVM